MSTLTPAWEQRADDCNFSNKQTATELHRSIRRRISSSLQPWEKYATTKAVPSRTSFPQEPQTAKSNGSDEEATSPNTSLLTNTVNADNHTNENSQQQENAKDNVEQEQNSADIGLGNQNVGNDEDNSTANISNRNRRYNRISMIIIYGREALCILALILTTYASIQNSTPRISKAPPPSPFFSRGSLVHDWPSGALGPTQTRVSLSELSLVFYYAPWCAESQHARSVFEHVARLYFKEAHFAAINCWQPGGECRLQYSKVQSWPVLMAYQPNGLAVQYHQVWSNAALSRFVQSLINPVRRLTGPGDLMSLMTGKDAVVVLFLNMNSNQKLYSRFYQTSLKWLEKDPLQEVAFGVVTGETSKAFGVEELPAIRLYLWNETIEFTANRAWTTTELTSWVNKHVQVVSMWIAPPGATKSSSLAPYFNHGPVMFFFTPRSMYGGSSDAYMMLRQLGMQYYNCQGDKWIEEMAKKYIAEQRRLNAEEHSRLSKQCEAVLRRHPSLDDDEGIAKKKPCKVSSKSAIAVSFVNVLNSSKFSEKIHKGRPLSADDYCEIERDKCDQRFYECGSLGEDDALNIGMSDGCERGQHKPSGLYGSVKVDRSTENPATSKLDSEQDYRGPKHLRKQLLRKECELLRLSELENSEKFFHEKHEKQEIGYIDAIRGMACRYNKTMTILGMDSTLYHAFAERLGVDVLHEPNKSVAIIVDHEDESTYLLRDNINLATMAKLVHNFYNRTYPRFLRSGSISFKNTHSFNLSEFRKESQRMVEVKRAEYAARVQTAWKENNFSQENEKRQNAADDDANFLQHHQHHLVREINSQNFDQVVVNSRKTVVVHFYSAQCAFCSMLSQHLLVVSRMFQQQPLLDFVRIDGDRNDLRWEYTMDTFPTLLIFPNQRKSESRVFSRSLQMTVPNVLGFILSNLSPPERLYANYLICENTKRSPPRESCLQTMKRELSESISLNLRLYRHAKKRPILAARILQRLQTLQEFYLSTLRCLSHSCDFTKLKNSAKTILNIWQMKP
ncbi:thioredoxin domain-containing protein 11 [Toxorhynchites rutilus septentrionalis]|uniref:thioredoxin domain-containing protein 11 n=1 Tax=Toxorhynchites rutilus septentrionalis TaxID=329112 RepID=UPI00247AFD8C|nr:thioredoxin domain-containing protein 11 [Toxorhynchites rutilus septentrionalis]